MQRFDDVIRNTSYPGAKQDLRPQPPTPPLDLNIQSSDKLSIQIESLARQISACRGQEELLEQQLGLSPQLQHACRYTPPTPCSSKSDPSISTQQVIGFSPVRQEQQLQRRHLPLFTPVGSQASTSSDPFQQPTSPTTALVRRPQPQTPYGPSQLRPITSQESTESESSECIELETLIELNDLLEQINQLLRPSRPPPQQKQQPQSLVNSLQLQPQNSQPIQRQAPPTRETSFASHWQATPQ